MKKLFTLLVTVFFTVVLFAQSPQLMSYQAVIRDAGNNLVNSLPVGMKISILQGSASGTVVYTETQTPTTNTNGLVSIEIGGGTGFDAINWSSGPYFLKTETDPTGGTSYTITGTSQILSVPYSLYTGEAGNGFASTYTDGEKRPVLNMTDGGVSIGAPPISNTKLNVNGMVNLTPGDFSTWGVNLALDATSQEGGASFAILSLSNGAGEGGGKFLIKNDNESSTLVMDNNGHTGINNLIPAHSLDVTGDINFTGALLQNGSPLAHTGDVTGSTALTVVGINGTSLAGLSTGILKNTTGTGVPSIAVAGTDYLAPNGSAASLTGFPIFNQNTTGSAASFTGNLAGDVTGTQGATVVGNSAVISKVLTGFTSGAGTVAATDNILQAIQKLNGNNPMHYIGESYGGGIVFYVYDNGQHGLIAATADQSTGEVWTTAAFQSTVSNAVRDGIEGGLANTERIIIQAGAGSYAAQLCANYQGGNYADWYLPSKYELNLLYLQKTVVGGFSNNFYFSSTEYSNIADAWGQLFSNGNQDYGHKSTAYYVRAIRSF